jgi:hypothetical protein
VKPPASLSRKNPSLFGATSCRTPASVGSGTEPLNPATQRVAARRAALYKVLADTPGVRVNSHTKDDLGRVAVEISRTATATGIEDRTFENPKTGAVLETAFAYPDGTKGTDLYLSVTSRDTVPPNPYRR